ncbi:MAG: class I SAM-dependent methyltransferase [Eubacteriales bacterium]
MQRKYMTNLLETAKSLLLPALRPDGVYVDFTMGNGHDTVFLSKTAPQGHIYAFDIQPAALESTSARLRSEGCPDNVTLICDSHAKVGDYIKEPLDGGLFNLGWLPGGDRGITTLRSSTFPALSAGLGLLKRGGVIVVSVYPGHEEGTLEGEELIEFAKSLDGTKYDALLHKIMNIKDCPFILGFQKK